MPPRRSLFRQPLLRTLALLVAATVVTPVSAERLLVRTYSEADGLISSHISSLTTDREGFLWVCSRGGLSRFDGSTFIAFPTRGVLPDAYVNHLLQTRSGTRWVATNGGGIARLESHPPSGEHRLFTPFPVGASDRSMRVNLLFETEDGALLAGTDGGLYRSARADGDPDFELVPLELPAIPDGGLQIWSMAAGRGGDLWIGTSAGLVRLRADGRTAHIPVRPLQGADHVWTVLVDEAGRLWLGHDLGLVVWLPRPSAAGPPAPPDPAPLLEGSSPCVRGSSAADPAATLPTTPGHACHWTPPDSAGNQDRLVRPELRTADGVVWLTHRNGLISFDGGRFQLYTQPQASPDWQTGTLAVDPGGDLWVRSRRGLARIARRGLTHYTTEDGLTERRVERIFQGPSRDLFAVTRSSHIHRFDGHRWTAVRPNVPEEVGRGGRSRYGAVLVDHRGEWWVGSGNGLYRFPRVAGIETLARRAPRAHYTTADGLGGDDVWCLYEDERGDLWIGVRVPTAAPLTRWRRRTGELERFGPAQGLPASERILGFAEDHSGGLWVNTPTGLFRFDGRRFHRLAPEGGMPPGRLGGSIDVDEAGSLWATVGDVLIRVTDPTAARPRVSSYRDASFMATGHGVYAVDADGWVYLRSFRGLARWRPAGGIYQQLDIGSSFTGPFRAFRADDGTIWFATGNGILRYQPTAPRAGQPPPVWIQGVRVAGVVRPVAPMGVHRLGPLRLTPDQRQLEIDYSGLGFGPDEPLRFQVRLEGAAAAWSEPTRRRSVLYAGLGPGRYRFQVRAVSAAGRISRRPATLAFTIPPPVWRRPWFFGLIGLALVALLAAAYRTRVRRLVHLERVRTRIAADLHDDLGANLARVSLLAEAARRKLLERPESAASMLTEIGDTARGLVLAAGDIAYSIDPGRGRLDGLVARLRRFAEELLDGTGIAWRLEVEGETSGTELSSDQRRHLLAILKEALHNAVRHGRPRSLSLTLSVRRGSLSAELVDDGRGFSSGVPGHGEEPPGGHGLRSMRQRAAELGGRIRIDSDPGTGTRLTLRVPL